MHLSHLLVGDLSWEGIDFGLEGALVHFVSLFLSFDGVQFSGSFLDVSFYVVVVAIWLI